MKQLIAALLPLLWTQAGVAQHRRPQPAAPADPPVVSIEQIDFRNYTFPLNGRSYKLIDGSYAETTGSNTQWGIEVTDGPYFADLTGDGRSEVALVLSYGQVATPRTTEARVYTLVGVSPVLLATFPISSGVNCMLDSYVRIEDGMLSVERIYGNGAACDHNEITRYRWNGNAFTPVGATRRMPCRCS